MFRTREPQESLWQSEFLITPRKARLMRRSWAQVFRNEAVPLIDEERFAEMYSADMGRPNRAVQTVLGVLVLKEMFDLTDIEALEELEFNLLWHHALGLEVEITVGLAVSRITARPATIRKRCCLPYTLVGRRALKLAPYSRCGWVVCELLAP